MRPVWRELAPDLFLWPEAANVYAIRRGDEVALVDSGSAEAVRHLGELGVRRVAHVLHTHHHRDQCAASGELAAQGALVWAPAAEVDLLGDPEGMWQGPPCSTVTAGGRTGTPPWRPSPLRAASRTTRSGAAIPP